MKKGFNSHSPARESFRCGVGLCANKRLLLCSARIYWLGWAKPAEEEDGLWFVVSDEEEKRVVSFESHCWDSWSHHQDSCGSCCLGTFFIDFHKSFVNNFRDEKILLHWHPCEISLTWVKSISYPHAAQRGVKVIILFHLQLGQVQIHFSFHHIVWFGPFSQFLIRQLSFHLQRVEEGNIWNVKDRDKTCTVLMLIKNIYTRWPNYQQRL